MVFFAKHTLENTGSVDIVPTVAELVADATCVCMDAVLIGVELNVDEFVVTTSCDPTDVLYIDSNCWLPVANEPGLLMAFNVFDVVETMLEMFANNISDNAGGVPPLCVTSADAAATTEFTIVESNVNGSVALIMVVAMD
jgi:hypothetical protein